jgi:hypothetical protein
MMDVNIKRGELHYYPVVHIHLLFLNIQIVFTVSAKRDGVSNIFKCISLCSTCSQSPVLSFSGYNCQEATQEKLLILQVNVQKNEMLFYI